MDYSNFKTEDFLADESFQDYVLLPENDDNELWMNFLKNHPEKRTEFMEAERLVQNLDLILQRATKLEMEQDFSEIEKFIFQPEKGRRRFGKRKKNLKLFQRIKHLFESD